MEKHKGLSNCRKKGQVDAIFSEILLNFAPSMRIYTHFFVESANSHWKSDISLAEALFRVRKGMMLRDIITAYSEDHMKRINALFDLSFSPQWQ
jgi:hypothetical protein